MSEQKRYRVCIQKKTVSVAYIDLLADSPEDTVREGIRISKSPILQYIPLKEPIYEAIVDHVWPD